MAVVMFALFVAEDSFQESSRCHLFLKSQPKENGALTGRMDAGDSSSYLLSPYAGDHVVFMSLSAYLYLNIISCSHPLLKLLHELPNHMLDLIVYFGHLPDYHGLSSIPGANSISLFQKDGPADSDDVTFVAGSQKTIDVASWEEVLEQSSRGFQTPMLSRVPSPFTQSDSTGIILGEENMTLTELLAGGNALKEELQSSVPIQTNWQVITSNVISLPFV